MQCVAVCYSVVQCNAVCRSVVQCVAVCCSVLQCVAVCCSVLQCVGRLILYVRTEYARITRHMGGKAGVGIVFRLHELTGQLLVCFVCMYWSHSHV